MTASPIPMVPETEDATEAGRYRPLKWQIVTDAKGFERIHETDEDGRPGDLVADVWGDHAALLVAAPRLHSALIALLSVAGFPMTSRQEAIFAEARAAIEAAQAFRQEQQKGGAE